ncbi:MAG: FKBP-type peptidyl-prolyl cis-trans isomerase [Coriobacteriia bacterium]|nr:FKBP-type peptidyl-prolyl cis-trans isomerase [Coriobacteriia bacterium]
MEKVTIKDVKIGKGPAAKAGDSVTVEYTGWLTNGAKFDSNVGGTPFPVTIGAGQVIEGWDQGLVGMKLGGTRILTIPPSLGYGAQGSPPAIPPNSTLKFQVKIISLTPGQ